MRTKRNLLLFVAWLTVSIGLAGYFAYGLWGEAQISKRYLPDAGSHGHYQIEMACNSCHGEGFASQDEMQQVCMDCHGEELKLADDSHPIKKFKDPRNADRVAILDARYCITCHVEHVPERTRSMGVTIADDFCLLCHEKVGDDRPSHKNLTFDSCSSAGCHNYHDNRALYEDFLVKHANEPALLDVAQLPTRDYKKVYQLNGKVMEAPLSASQNDAAPEARKPLLIAAWAGSTHAAAGVNCSDCHQSPWQEMPTIAVCDECHQNEAKGFGEGHHGMRLAQALPAMTPQEARQPMRNTAKQRQLSCDSCHDVHQVDSRHAAVEACLECHDDTHSQRYKQSPHYQRWLQEQSGDGIANSGVSCASCHLPRVEVQRYGESFIQVQHNQNNNLRPNEKMIREVCMHCHGLGFSIDALADAELINRNFKGSPSQHIESIDWAVSRVK